MFRDKLLRNAKACDDMVEKEPSCCVSQVIEGGHGLDLLSEIVNGEDDVLMTIFRCKLRFHEVDS
jgi:hypothetical protein